MSEMQYIQSNLHVPKNQENKFGKYKYRSCEDIVEAAKSVLSAVDCWLNVSDEIVMLGDRFYVKATASVMKDTVCIASACGFAREAFEQKGMQESQLTGSTSSYARKCALNGLFAIDDTKDADTVNNQGYEQINPEPINQTHVDGVYDMYLECLHEDVEEINYSRMKAGDARLSNDERIEVMNKLKLLGKFPETNKAYTTIVNECLKHKEEIT